VANFTRPRGWTSTATVVALLFVMREEFEVAILLALFVLSNALTVLAMRAVGLSLDFWVALILVFFVVGANAGFLALVANCAEEENSLLPCAFYLFTIPALAWLAALPKWLPPVSLEGVPWRLVAQAAFAAASVALAVLAAVRRSLKLAAYAAMLVSILIFAVVISS